MRESYGDLEALEKLGNNKKLPFTKEQLKNEKLKNIDGESNIEVLLRMNEFFSEILHSNTSYKNIAIISHGAAIKFFLRQFCVLDENFNLIYNNKILKINSPSVFKITINGNQVNDIQQIY